MNYLSDAKHRVTRVPLIEGHKMRCPRCKELFDILQFVRLIQTEEFVSDTTPVYKCPRNAVSKGGNTGCGFLFAPAESAIKNSMIVGGTEQ
jgi:heterodisulfide reductase subunit C